MNGFERYTKKTRRQVFLEEMEQVVPWREVCALIEPHYLKPGNGRPPVGVERMLPREISGSCTNGSSSRPMVPRAPTRGGGPAAENPQRQTPRPLPVLRTPDELSQFTAVLSGSPSSLEEVA
jgi:hypothetical protein